MAEPRRDGAMRTLVHPAVAVLVPFAFLAALDALLRGGMIGAMAPRPAAGFRIVVLLAGAAETAIANFLQRERLGGFGARVRELVLVLAGAGLAAWLLSGRPFRGEPSPVAFEVLWPVLLAGAQWLLTLFVHQILRERELFLSLVEGRDGPALKLAAREAAGEAGGSAQGLARLRRMVVGFEAAVLVLLIGVYVGRAGEGGWWVPVAVGHEILGLLALSVLAAFTHEQSLLAAGISVDGRRLGGWIAGAAVSVALLTVAAAAIAGARPVLPLSILAALLAALSRFFTVERAPAVPPPPGSRPIEGGTGDGMRELLEQLARQETPAWLELLMKVLGYALAAAAALSALYFLLRPLLRRDTRLALRNLHPLAALRRALARFAALAIGMPRALGAWLREGRHEALAVLRAAAAGGRGGGVARMAPGPVRRGRASRPVREYVRLVRWGERHGVRFDRAEGPAEYAARLAVAVPSRATALAAAAAAFERIVYAAAPGPAEERELADLVRGVVRKGP